MAYRRVIIERGEKFSDEECRYRFKWSWLDEVWQASDSAAHKVRYGQWFRKLASPGKAYCVLCQVELNYGNRGGVVFHKHANSESHRQRVASEAGNTTLPGQPLSRTTTYGLHPAFSKTVTQSEAQPLEPLVPFDDRVKNLEAMTLAFAAENSLSLATIPNLLDFAKAAAKDPKALAAVCMDRTTASYKMKYGLAQTLQNEVVEELKTCPFSLNIDEATSKTNTRVLTILSSHFSESQSKIVIHHLASFDLVKVTAQSLFEEVEKVMISFDLPWENLVSVLMDSCRVMRGEKSGLEKRIRDRAPHLLDIDGDSCHHAHIAAQEFCKPFSSHVESLLSDIHTEFKWSVDSKESFFELCMALGIKSTAPERYVPHRWLSVLNVTLDTLRLLDALTLYTASFIPQKDREIYKDITDEVLTAREVSSEGKSAIARCQEKLRKKWSSFTKDGKDRKLRMFEKLFVMRKETLAVLSVYKTVLPTLKEYVLFFQKREPVVHRLHDKQCDLLNSFLSFFIKPEVLTEGKLQKLDLEDGKFHLPLSLILLNLGNLKLPKGLGLMEKITRGFINCGSCLQRKMPLNNITLKICSVLDPTTRGTTTALKLLHRIPSVTNLVPSDVQDVFAQEVKNFNTDRKLDSISTDLTVDLWWASVSPEEFPLLTKAAKGLLSCFHGPMVEGCFSMMGDVLDEKKARMDIQTYSAIQSIKFHLHAKKQTSVEMFGKANPIKDPVCKKLTSAMSRAWKVNEQRKSAMKRKKEDQQEALGTSAKRPVPSKAFELKIIAGTSKDQPTCQDEAIARRKDTEESAASSQSVPPTPNSQDVQIQERRKKQSSISSFFQQK